MLRPTSLCSLPRRASTGPLAEKRLEVERGGAPANTSSRGSDRTHGVARGSVGGGVNSRHHTSKKETTAPAAFPTLRALPLAIIALGRLPPTTAPTVPIAMPPLLACCIWAASRATVSGGDVGGEGGWDSSVASQLLISSLLVSISPLLVLALVVMLVAVLVLVEVLAVPAATATASVAAVVASVVTRP